MPSVDHRFETKEQVILQHLENTGRHLLDSGDFYGRGWERSRQAAIAVLGNEPDLTPGSDDIRRLVELHDEGDAGHIDWADLTPTINLYWWMTEHMEYDSRIQEWFDRFVVEQDEKEDLGVWNNYAPAFWYWLGNHRYDPETWELIKGDEADQETESIDLRPVLGGGPGDDPVWAAYTYNHENALSRDIVLTVTEFDDAIYCLVQLHNGCDARGGFTKPRAYQWMGESEYGFADWDSCAFVCTNEDHDWQNRHIWDRRVGDCLYQGSTHGPDLLGCPAYDLADEECPAFRIWEDLGLGRRRPLTPQALYDHIKLVELPELSRSLSEGPYDKPYKVEEHLKLLLAGPPDADEAINLYRQMLWNVFKDDWLGVRFYDSDQDKGYCPVCGHELEFHPQPC